MGPIKIPPFYVLEVWPGHAGTRRDKRRSRDGRARPSSRRTWHGDSGTVCCGERNSLCHGGKLLCSRRDLGSRIDICLYRCSAHEGAATLGRTPTYDWGSSGLSACRLTPRLAAILILHNFIIGLSSRLGKYISFKLARGPIALRGMRLGWCWTVTKCTV